MYGYIIFSPVFQALFFNAKVTLSQTRSEKLAAEHADFSKWLTNFWVIAGINDTCRINSTCAFTFPFYFRRVNKMTTILLT